MDRIDGYIVYDVPDNWLRFLDFGSETQVGYISVIFRFVFMKKCFQPVLYAHLYNFEEMY